MNEYVQRLIDKCGGDYGGRWWKDCQENYVQISPLQPLTFLPSTYHVVYTKLLQNHIEAFRQRCILYLLDMIAERAKHREQVLPQLQEAMEEVLYG